MSQLGAFMSHLVLTQLWQWSTTAFCSSALHWDNRLHLTKHESIEKQLKDQVSGANTHYWCHWYEKQAVGHDPPVWKLSLKQNQNAIISSSQRVKIHYVNHESPKGFARCYLFKLGFTSDFSTTAKVFSTGWSPCSFHLQVCLQQIQSFGPPLILVVP
jgi:hypothetical protein